MNQLIQYNRDLDTMIAGWLHEKHGRTESKKTLVSYRTTITEFRAYLHHQGLDLDGDRRAIRLLAQSWLGQGRKGPLAPASYNQRKAALSSFYEYCMAQEFLDRNPMHGVALRPVEQFRGAEPIPAEVIAERLGEIDRTIPLGKRDFALLVVSLLTGRRLSEVSDLRYQNVHWKAASKMLDPVQAILRWPRTKGGKSAGDELPEVASLALKDWMDERAKLLPLEVEDHVWISLAWNGSFGRPLTPKSLERVALARLGTSKFHALRHSFAITLLDAGADVTELQHRLGHADLKTTGIYAQRLRGDRNPHSAKMAEMFGITEA